MTRSPLDLWPLQHADLVVPELLQQLPSISQSWLVFTDDIELEPAMAKLMSGLRR